MTCEFVFDESVLQRAAMKPLFAGMSLLMLLFGSTALRAQTTHEQAHVVPKKHSIEIARSGSQQPNKAPAEHFTGSVVIEPVVPAHDPSLASGGKVKFEAGARSAWHTHPLGQILIVTDGTGWIQQWGDPVEEIRKGDVVWIPAGVKHWHGATPKTAMTHIAIQEQLDGKVVEWLEKVTDDQYRRGLRHSPWTNGGQSEASSSDDRIAWSDDGMVGSG
jgi:quercetin dioxygenase-like cupin family protein